MPRHWTGWCGSCRRWKWRPTPSGAHFSPTSPTPTASGSNAIIAVGEAGRDVGRVRSELQRMADDVRASHREYEYAEARNALLLRMGLHGSEYGSRRRSCSPCPSVARDIVEDWVAMAPRNLAVLAGPARAPGRGRRRPGGPCGRPPPGPGLPRRRRGSRFSSPGRSASRAEETLTADVDLSPAGLLRRAGAVGEPGGRIEVIEVGTAASRPAWVVIIPGTQQGGLPGRHQPLRPRRHRRGLGL